MKSFVKIFAGIILISSVAMGSQELNASTEKTGPAVVGVGLLATEFIGGPIFASRYWWQDGFGVNPFSAVFEKEHYFEDKAWHFWTGDILTQYHYWIFKHFFGDERPYISMTLTFIALTAVEIFDASDFQRKWGFSIMDEVANVAGIGFWYAKYRYPSIPVDVRIGVRRWDALGRYVERITHYYKSKRKYFPGHIDNYSIFKVEFIVRPKKYFYLGFSSSLDDTNGIGIDKNLFGVTVGFDIMRFGADKLSKWRDIKLLRTLSRYTALDLQFTYWFKRQD